MNISDLLAQTLAFLKRLPGQTGCQVTFQHGGSLGTFQGEAGGLQQALTLLIRGAMRASARSRLVLHAERFTDDFTEQDWLEISLPTPVAMAEARQRQVETIMERIGGSLDLEAAPVDGFCVYRIYVPCTRLVVPFPGNCVAVGE